MEKLGRKIVRFRIPIFIIGLLLLIPSVFGYTEEWQGFGRNHPFSQE